MTSHLSRAGQKHSWGCALFHLIMLGLGFCFLVLKYPPCTLSKTASSGRTSRAGAAGAAGFGQGGPSTFHQASASNQSNTQDSKGDPPAFREGNLIWTSLQSSHWDYRSLGVHEGPHTQPENKLSPPGPQTQLPQALLTFVNLPHLSTED